jgi:hypothetical protein
MRDIALAIVGIILAFFLILAMGTVGGLWNFQMFSYFAPKVVAVDNKVFHESQQYNDGMANQLAQLHLQYVQAKDPDTKAAIASLVRHQFGGYDRSRLPLDLQSFYNQIGG